MHRHHHLSLSHPLSYIGIHISLLAFDHEKGNNTILTIFQNYKFQYLNERATI